MREEGFEPTKARGHKILSLAHLTELCYSRTNNELKASFKSVEDSVSEKGYKEISNSNRMSPEEFDEVLKRFKNNEQLNEDTRQEFADYIQELAYMDKDTGLFNKHVFHTELHQAVRLISEPFRAQKYRFDSHVLYIDIDNFGKYNKLYGHPTGDILRNNIAIELRTEFKLPDIIARYYGGDEFTVLAHRAGPDLSFRDAVKNIFISVNEKIRYLDNKDITSLSAGKRHALRSRKKSRSCYEVRQDNR
jgi:diguanylate cyclase (GGDEF)-like protein